MTKRVTGEARKELALEVRRLYEQDGLRLTEIASKLEVSYGKVHALLKESGGAARRRGRGDASSE